MIQIAKGIKIENFNFYSTFQHFGSNVVLAIKCMNFEDVFLIKSYSFLCEKTHDCTIYMMYNQGVVKNYFILKYYYKLGMQNGKFGSINHTS